MPTIEWLPSTPVKLIQPRANSSVRTGKTHRVHLAACHNTPARVRRNIPVPSSGRPADGGIRLYAHTHRRPESPPEFTNCRTLLCSAVWNSLNWTSIPSLPELRAITVFCFQPNNESPLISSGIRSRSTGSPFSKCFSTISAASSGLYSSPYQTLSGITQTTAPFSQTSMQLVASMPRPALEVFLFQKRFHPLADLHGTAVGATSLGMVRRTFVRTHQNVAFVPEHFFHLGG